MAPQTLLAALAAGLAVGVLTAHAIVASSTAAPRRRTVRRLLWTTTRLVGRFVPRGVLAFAVIFLLAVGVGPWTGKYRTVTVLTASMKPGMPPGSMAVLVPVDPASIRVGDVITFQAPIPDHPVVTHRVIAIVEPGSHPVIRTQGDANDSPDPWTAKISDSTAWRRVAVIPVIGTLIHSLRSPLVHQATVYVVPGLLAIAWLIGIWSRDSKTNRTRPASAALAASVAGTPLQ